MMEIKIKKDLLMTKTTSDPLTESVFQKLIDAFKIPKNGRCHCERNLSEIVVPIITRFRPLRELFTTNLCYVEWLPCVT